MAKITLEESDIISIAQLWARTMVVSNNSEEQRELIMARMSDEAEDFFIKRMLPPCQGRTDMRKLFAKAKGRKQR